MQRRASRLYEDEVDIHLNLKIGADWQLRGQYKRVVTSGQNEKYYLAGALHNGTGKVSYIVGNSKSSVLFICLLQHLKTTFRRAKTITLIMDNYKQSKSACRSVSASKRRRTSTPLACTSSSIGKGQNIV